MKRRWRLVVFSIMFIARSAPGLALGFWGLLALTSLIPTGLVYVLGQMAATAAAGDAAGLGTWAVGWVGLLLFSQSTGPLIALLEGNLNERLTFAVNRTLMEHVKGFWGLEPFEDESFYAQVRLLRREATYAPMNLSIFLGQAMRGVFTVLPLLALVGRWSPWLPLGLLLATLPYAVAGVRLQQLVWSTVVANDPEARRMEYATGVLLSSEHAAETRVYESGGFWLRRYRANFDRLHARARATRRREVVTTTAFLLPTALGLGGTFAAVLRLGVGVGGVVEVAAALQRLQTTLVELVDALGMLERSLFYMEALRDFLASRPGLASGPRLRVGERPPRITFEDVHFSYPDGRTALVGVSLTLEPGRLHGLVGENGAGKTTLVKLLLRFYDPSRGRILVDGVDLRELDLAAWRRRAAAVFQSFGRYALELGENVALREVGPGDEAALLHALAQAGAVELARGLPHGLATMLSKEFGGTEVSGGEWQKVALARAFFRKGARLMVLDEPSAALDPRSEAHLFRRFAELAAGRTALLVSHRLGSVRSAERIFVFKQGRLLEEGTHEALLSMGGEYAELWRLQSRAYA